MGIFPALVEKRERYRTGGSAAVYDDFWYSLVGGDTAAGVQVNEKTALKYLTMFACVSLIAGDMARIPLVLYRRTGKDSKERALDHPLYDICHTAPNPEMTAFLWREAGLGHNLLWGNHYSVVKRRPLSGEVTGIWPIDNPGLVQVKRDRKGRIFYEWYGRSFGGSKADEMESGISEDQAGTGFRRHKKFKKDMLHIPGFGFNGLFGLSMVRIAREAIGAGLAMEEFGSRYFGQGTHLGGSVSMDHDLGEEEDEYLKKLKNQYASLKNSHGLIVFQNGETFTPYHIPLEDAQFLESRDHQKIEICGMYHVPPHKIAIHGQNSNFNNLEQENQTYVDSCLIHWATRWETSLAHQLLTPAERASGLFFEHLLAGLLRGDTKARGEFYNKLFGVGGISPNEIRAKENMNPDPSPEADQKYVMINMMPLNQVGDTEPIEKDNEFNSTRESRVIVLAHRSYATGLVRLQNSYHRIIKKTMQDIVNKETLQIKRAVKKFLTERGVSGFQTWIEAFYEEHAVFVSEKLKPILVSYQELVLGQANTLLGPEAIVGSGEMEVFFDDTVKNLVNRHVKSHSGQLTKIIKDMSMNELTELAKAVDERMAEWYLKDPKKIADNEVVRFANATAREVWIKGGIRRFRWQTRGKNCPFCNSLKGKVVGRKQAFLDPGDVIYASDQGWTDIYNPVTGQYKQKESPDSIPDYTKVSAMKSYGSRFHPPTHQGCDCVIVPG